MKLIRLLYMIRFCAILVPFIFSTLLYAVEVKDLYQAKIPVASQAKAERNRALKQALQAVIVKVSGQETAVDNDVIKQAVAKHQQYLSQYSYQRSKSDQVNTDLANSYLVKHKLALVASFDENKINQLFQQADLSLWGNLRPQVLVWLVEEKGLSRSILSGSSRSPLPEVANDYARQRGLPVIMPLMDLTDASQIRTSDIWGRFVEPVRTASNRYYPEAIAVIRISNSSLLPQLPQAEQDQDCILCQQNNLVLDWSLLTDKQIFGQRRQSNDAKLLIQQALAEITQTIYQGYAQSPTSNNELILDVANVNSLKTYMAVSLFLENLSSVQSVRLISARGTNRRFNLTLLGGKQALLASLKLNKMLQQHLDPLAEVRPDDIPVFYWGKS